MYHLSPSTTLAFMDRYKFFEDRSIEEVEASFMALDAPYKVTPTGRRCDNTGTTVSHCAIGEVQLVCSRWGAPMTGTSLVDQGTISIGVPISGATELIDPNFGRIKPKPTEARIFRPGTGASLIGFGPRTVLDLVLPYRSLQQRARTFHQNELNEPLRFAPVLDLNSAGGRMILNLIEYIKTHLLNDPASVNHPLVTTNLQEHVISTIFETLPHNYKDPVGARADCAVPRSVRCAEEYMRAHADQPVTVEILARHAGCSERALHNAFKAFRNKTPMAMLRDIRLEGAHSDMKSGTATITDIALKWGFSNPGRFSKLYAEKFGCKPSETLKFAAA